MKVTDLVMLDIKHIDLLPYHIMGITKYEQLGIDYPLKGVLPSTKEYSNIIQFLKYFFNNSM